MYTHTDSVYEEKERFVLQKIEMRRKITSLLLSKINVPGSRIFKAIVNCSFNIIKIRNLSNTPQYNSE